MEESEKIPLTAVDRIANGDGLQMIKAAIPYLPDHAQKSFSLYIKIMEIGNVLSYYNNPIRACSAADASAEDIINDIRPYCSDMQRQSLDQAVQLFHTLKMYQEMQKMSQGGNSFESSGF